MTPVNFNDEVPFNSTDGDLLAQFIEQHDESAFAKLVQSHGPMVLGVCRRVIGNQHDAEDAFQATFLVFARKAHSICAERTIAGWLYGVAYRTALKARTSAMKKKMRETPLPDDLQSTPPETEQWSALRPVLDQELNRLPESYRLPLVLCYLEGKSYAEAAAQLGCPEGTLSVRLMRAKTKLADFLRRRGLVLSVATLGSLMTYGTASASVLPAALTTSTIKAASLFATSSAAVSSLASNEVTSLANSVLNAIQFPRLVALSGTAAITTGLVAVGLSGVMFSGGGSDTGTAVTHFYEWFTGRVKYSTTQEMLVPFEPRVVDLRPAAHEPGSEIPSNNDQPSAQTKDVPSAQNSDPMPTNPASNLTPNAEGDVADSQWGSITGRVTVDGTIPPLPRLVKKLDPAAKDSAVCAANDIPDESIVIDSESKGLANVVFWLTKKPATIHPDLTESKDKEVVFDQSGCQFIPHVLLVRTDQRVRTLSDDAVAHNTHTYPLKNRPVNSVIAPNDRSGLLIPAFTEAERLPIQVGCDIHPCMRAWWVILDHPYAAVTDKEGRFEIANLPVGDHEFRVWHEHIGYVEKSYRVTVKPGKNLQPSFVVSAKTLLEKERPLRVGF